MEDGQFFQTKGDEKGTLYSGHGLGRELTERLDEAHLVHGADLVQLDDRIDFEAAFWWRDEGRCRVAALSAEIRRRASILYVWVEPEESRRRNRERAMPGREGDASILHHGVPEAVMIEDYGIDDMYWLEGQARLPGTIPIGSADIPMQRLDNRDDRTSFLRAEPAEWPTDAVDELHRDLSSALLRLADR